MAHAHLVPEHRGASARGQVSRRASRPDRVPDDLARRVRDRRLGDSDRNRRALGGVAPRPARLRLRAGRLPAQRPSRFSAGASGHEPALLRVERGDTRAARRRDAPQAQARLWGREADAQRRGRFSLLVCRQPPCLSGRLRRRAPAGFPAARCFMDASRYFLRR